MSILDAALGYTESSPQWRIFPVNVFTKQPIIKTGTDHAEFASSDPAMIQSWASCGMLDAIGMPTGAATGTVVVDVDRKHDGERLLAELEHPNILGPLPRIRVVRTQSGGLHIYCAHPGAGIRVRTGAGPKSALGKLLGGVAGIDVRADGGIVVLPPSCGYSWIHDDDERLPVLPKRWLAAIQGAGDPPPPKRSTVFQPARSKWSDATRGAVVGEGSRSDFLYRRGAALHLAGASDDEVMRDLEAVNAARCSPSVGHRELIKIAASATRATGRAS